MTDPCELPAFYATSEEISRVLREAKIIAVIGASPKPERPSHLVMDYLHRAGYRVVPVNPGQKEVMGETCYSSLADIPFPVDVADIFLHPDRVPPVVDQAIAKGVKTVWMQSGIVDNASAERARAAGLTVIMNKCMKVEHARRGAGSPLPRKLA